MWEGRAVAETAGDRRGCLPLTVRAAAASAHAFVGVELAVPKLPHRSRAQLHVPPHGFARAHENLNNRLELGAVLCTGACTISIYNTLQRAASRAV